jgi:hypothetical protein
MYTCVCAASLGYLDAPPSRESDGGLKHQGESLVRLEESPRVRELHSRWLLLRQHRSNREENKERENIAGTVACKHTGGPRRRGASCTAELGARDRRTRGSPRSPSERLRFNHKYRFNLIDQNCRLTDGRPWFNQAYPFGVWIRIVDLWSHGSEQIGLHKIWVVQSWSKDPEPIPVRWVSDLIRAISQESDDQIWSVSLCRALFWKSPWYFSIWTRRPVRGKPESWEILWVRPRVLCYCVRSP